MATLDKTLGAESPWARLRRAALWLLFAIVLLIPKVLRLRRSAPVWNTLRLIAVSLGAGLLVAVMAGRPHASAAAVFAAVLVILALALPPERSNLSSAAAPGAATDALARELGAAIVLRGGSHRAADGRTVDTRFFVGPERLSILSPALDRLFVIPLAKLSVLRAEPAQDGWKLSLVWDAGAAEFFYRGPFAEHFARAAESTLRSQMPGVLPILR